MPVGNNISLFRIPNLLGVSCLGIPHLTWNVPTYLIFYMWEFPNSPGISHVYLGISNLLGVLCLGIPHLPQEFPSWSGISQLTWCLTFGNSLAQLVIWRCMVSLWVLVEIPTQRNLWYTISMKSINVLRTSSPVKCCYRYLQTFPFCKFRPILPRFLYLEYQHVLGLDSSHLHTLEQWTCIVQQNSSITGA